MAKMLNLGYDRGNARTNVATLYNGHFIEIDNSSYVSVGDLSKYNTMKAGSASAGEIANDLILEYDDTTYFLGETAHQGRHATTDFGDLNRYSGRNTKVSILLHTLLIAQKLWPNSPTNEIIVNLVMGVPLQAHKEKSATIKENLAGSYRCTFNGRAVEIHIEDNPGVFIEGTGIAVLRGLDKSSTTGIIDSGSLTTGYIQFDGTRANPEKSGSFDIGVNSALDKLNSFFEQQYDRALSEKELQIVLRASIGQGAYPELWSEGKKVNGTLLHEWMKKAIEETGNEKNTIISRHWRDDKGKVAAGFSGVLHGGGGAYYFHKSLQKIIKSAVEIDEPEKANARGNAILADQIGQRRAAKGA